MSEAEGLAEILPGRLWALGGWLETGPGASPVSWIPPGARGFLPVQGYALRDGESWLMVDTGLPVHWPLVAEGVARSSAGCRARRLITTRREQDCMNGLPGLARDFGLDEVLYAGVLNPLDFFEGVEEAEAAGRIGAALAGAPRVRATRIAPGETVRLGALELEVLRVELRLLATNWFYERATRSLFTSDALGFLTRPRRGMSRLRARRGEAPIRSEEAALFLSAKMDWLAGAEVGPVLADLERIEAGWPAERLCPGFGLVVEGREAVAEAFAATREAVRELGARPRRPYAQPPGLDAALAGGRA